jgi:hypothetical protein
LSCGWTGPGWRWLGRRRRRRIEGLGLQLGLSELRLWRRRRVAGVATSRAALQGAKAAHDRGPGATQRRAPRADARSGRPPRRHAADSPAGLRGNDTGLFPTSVSAPAASSGRQRSHDIAATTRPSHPARAVRRTARRIPHLQALQAAPPRASGRPAAEVSVSLPALRGCKADHNTSIPASRTLALQDWQAVRLRALILSMREALLQGSRMQAGSVQ